MTSFKFEIGDEVVYFGFSFEKTKVKSRKWKPSWECNVYELEDRSKCSENGLTLASEWTEDRKDRGETFEEIVADIVSQIVRSRENAKFARLGYVSCEGDGI